MNSLKYRLDSKWKVCGNILVLVLFFMGTSAFGGGKSACRAAMSTAETVVPTETVRRLNIYNFYAHRSFYNAYVASYTRQGDAYRPDQLGTLRSAKTEGGHADVNILNRLQSFSTYMRGGRGSEKEQVLESRENLLSFLNPKQVVFFEITHPVEQSVVQRSPEEYPVAVRSDQPDFSNTGTVAIRDSALWVVAGQYRRSGAETFSEGGFNDPVRWETNGGQKLEASDEVIPPYRLVGYSMQALPWQRTSGLLEQGRLPISPFEPSVLVDRSRYPIIFEVGRLAQQGENGVDALYKAAVSWMYHEVVVTLQGNVQDASVFVRVEDVANRRRMQSMGFQPIEGAELGESSVLTIPLANLIDRFGLLGLTTYAQNLKKHLPSVPDEVLASGMFWLQSKYVSMRDFIVEDFQIVQEEPIVVVDYSVNSLLQIDSTLSRILGPSRDRSHLIDLYLDIFANNWVDFRHSEFMDWVPLRRHQGLLKSLNAIVLTNLDGRIAAKNSMYLKILLMAQEGGVRRSHDEIGVLGQQTFAALERLGLQYVIATRDPVVVKQARELGMIEVEVEGVPFGQSLEYFFRIDRNQFLENMKSTHPVLLEKLQRSGLDMGLWTFDHFSANPTRL